MRVVVTDAEVTLADVLSLRLAIDEPLSAGSELVLRQRGTSVEHRLALGATAARARDATLAFSLAPLPLSPGRWDTYVTQDGSRTRLHSVDPGFSLDHIDAYALSRRTMSYRAYRTRNGFLALKVDEAEPVAEVRAVWFREGRFEVTGLLAYTGLDDDESRHEARLSLRHDASGTALSSVATVQGVRFHAALSLCDLCDVAADDPGQPTAWAPSLEIDDLPAPLRLASRLDDVNGKRRRLHYPATKVDGVPIRPRYTADDELTIEVGG